MPIPYVCQLKKQSTTFSFVVQWHQISGIRFSSLSIFRGLFLRPSKTSSEPGGLCLVPPKGDYYGTLRFLQPYGLSERQEIQDVSKENLPQHLLLSTGPDFFMPLGCPLFWSFGVC